jgi:hypothetical protein
MQLNSTTCSKRRRACALAGEAFWLNSPGYGVVVHLCYRATGVSSNGGTPSSYVISKTTSKGWSWRLAKPPNTERIRQSVLCVQAKCVRSLREKDFTKPYATFVKKVVWLEGRRRCYPSTRSYHYLYIVANSLMTFDNNFYIN